MSVVTIYALLEDPFAHSAYVTVLPMCCMCHFVFLKQTMYVYDLRISALSQMLVSSVGLTSL